MQRSNQRHSSNTNKKICAGAKTPPRIKTFRTKILCLLELDEILEQAQEFVTQLLFLQGKINVGG